jgi:hypothetical protein
MKFLQIFFTLLIGTTVVSFSAVSLEPSNAQIIDPFAEFADVFPGQPKSAAAARGFSCPAGAYGAPDEYCFLNPTMGVFSQVGVSVSGGIIRQIDFTMRGYNLRLGTLILLWGMPQLIERNLVWPARGVTASTLDSVQKLTPLLVMRRVYMRDYPLTLNPSPTRARDLK